MITSNSPWRVSEQELEAEISLLTQSPGYECPPEMPKVRYMKLMREIAYWHISKFNVLTMGGITVFLIVTVVLVINWLNKSPTPMSVLIPLLLKIIAIYLIIYAIVHFIFIHQKRKLKTS